MNALSYNLREVYPKEFLQDTLYYVSLLSRISPLLDCADAVEIDLLGRNDYLNDKEAQKAFRIIRKYTPLLQIWGR